MWNDDIATAEAFGNVVYNDVVNKNMFTGGYCYYEDITGYVMATDSAVVIDYSQQDTMYAHADTFKVFTYNIDTDSVYRMVHGYYHLRAYRQDVQAVCDSMVYDSRDSILCMYRDPILWQAGQQQLGEEIRIFFNHRDIDSVQVLRQALSVEKIDSILLEGGGELNWSALREGIVSKVQAYIAPKLFGGSGKTPVGGTGVPFPSEAFMLEKCSVTSVGEDILIESRVKNVHGNN